MGATTLPSYGGAICPKFDLDLKGLAFGVEF
jgi:hypothetical protein